MVFHPELRSLLLHGGGGAGAALVYELSLSEDYRTGIWSAHAPPDARGPGKRSSTCFVFDRQRGHAVLFGGRAETEGGSTLFHHNDVWFLDIDGGGLRWTRAPDAGLTPSPDPYTCTFDPTEGVLYALRSRRATSILWAFDTRESLAWRAISIPETPFELDGKSGAFFEPQSRVAWFLHDARERDTTFHGISPDDPVRDWTVLTPPETSRGEHRGEGTAALLLDGGRKVFLAGGAPQFVPSLLDLRTGSRRLHRPAGTYPNAQLDGVYAMVPSRESIYFYGGRPAERHRRFEVYHRELWRFDLSSRQYEAVPLSWATPNPLDEPRLEALMPRADGTALLLHSTCRLSRLELAPGGPATGEHLDVPEEVACGHVVFDGEATVYAYSDGQVRAYDLESSTLTSYADATAVSNYALLGFYYLSQPGELLLLFEEDEQLHLHAAGASPAGRWSDRPIHSNGLSLTADEENRLHDMVTSVPDGEGKVLLANFVGRPGDSRASHWSVWRGLAALDLASGELVFYQPRHSPHRPMALVPGGDSGTFYALDGQFSAASSLTFSKAAVPWSRVWRVSLGNMEANDE